VYTGEAIPLALRTYLDRNPQTEKVVLHLDNDEVGRQATAQIAAVLKDKYEVVDDPSPTGKDWNDHLQNEIKRQNQRKEQSR